MPAELKRSILNFYPNLGRVGARRDVSYFLPLPCFVADTFLSPYASAFPDSFRICKKAHDALDASSVFVARAVLASSGDADVEGGDPTIASGPSISARTLNLVRYDFKTER